VYWTRPIGLGPIGIGVFFKYYIHAFIVLIVVQRQKTNYFFLPFQCNNVILSLNQSIGLKCIIILSTWHHALLCVSTSKQTKSDSEV
jgi:hypothetical protein